MLRLSDHLVNRILKEKELLLTLVTLVQVNQWNNMLHVQVDKLLNMVLEGDSFCLIIELVSSYDIKEVFYQIVESYNTQKVRQGNMGFLIQVSQKIRRFSLANELEYQVESEF